MELRPKARKKDVEMYIESCRTKFGCFETGGPGEDLAGKYIIQITHPSPFLLAKFRFLSSLSCLDVFFANLDFPEPIKESIQVLRNHIYIPLSDVQIAREEELEKQRYAQCTHTK